jgi:prepilin-type N-terminal cleavage/methylation domain-containing protein
MRMKAKRGFTLIELLVVIAIIGLLSTFAVVQLGSARKKARDAKRITDIKQLKAAFTLAIDASGGFPPSTSGVTRCLGVSSCWYDGTNSATVDAAIRPYINPIPADPVADRMYNAYTYKSPGSYWTPTEGTVSGGANSYAIAWQPELPSDSTVPSPAQCEAMGGIWGSWDNGGEITHCPPGGSCRQCGILIRQ